MKAVLIKGKGTPKGKDEETVEQSGGIFMSVPEFMYQKTIINTLEGSSASLNVISPPSRCKFQFVMETDDITEEWSIRDVALKRCPLSYEKAFSRLGPTFDHIQKTIRENTPGRVVPLRKNLFRALHLCPLTRVKVLVIGQDPYYTIMDNGEPDATGMAFSTWRNARLRDSVENIYLEVKTDYPSFKIPDHGDLTGWAQQGVLLLNASLTTIAGKDKAHPFIWMGVISAIIDEIKEVAPHTVVMLWGKDAQKFLPRLGKLNYLIAAHPSNKSAQGGFFGTGHFKQANELLVSSGVRPIDWSRL